MVSAVLDVEFTSFVSPKLLSVGMVLLDGAELYVEMDPDSALGTLRLAASSRFVREVVAPQIGVSRASACTTEHEMAQRICAWLNLHGVTRILADSEIDFFLLRALGALPKCVVTVLVQAEYVSAHHALEDARRLTAALIRSTETGNAPFG